MQITTLETEINEALSIFFFFKLKTFNCWERWRKCKYTLMNQLLTDLKEMLQGSQLEIICPGIWNMLRLTFPEPDLDAFHVLICTWEKVYGIKHTGFSKLLFNFCTFKPPSKLWGHIPAEDFPVQDKNQKTCAMHSDNPRKKNILLWPYASKDSLIPMGF